MKLYDCTRAPNPRRVRIFMAEKNLDIPKQEVDLAKGEHLSDAYRAINPECAVPVLELDDGTTISEVLAICTYLESMAPEPLLFGKSAEERAQVLMWNSRLEYNGLAGVAEYVRNTLPGFKDRAISGTHNYAQIPELAERGKHRSTAYFDRLDQHLEGRDFIALDAFSIADITAMVVIDFARWLKLDLTDGNPNLQRWYQSVSTRPSAKA